MSTDDTEKQIETYLVKRAFKANWLIFKFTSPNNRGVPDRLAILPGGDTIYIEVKRATGKLSALQERMIRTIKRKGARVYVVYSREQVDTLIEWEIGHALTN